MEQESQKREVEETGCEIPNGPLLCANNCGFFGTAATNNMCSKCFKDFFLKQTKVSAAIVSEKKKSKEEPVVVEAVGAAVECQDVKTDAPGSEESTSEGPAKCPTNRCSFCKKKVGLTGFKCRCDQTFCSLHRYSDKHNCVFDYKGAAQDAIAKANPVVKVDKIDKI